MKHPRQHNSTLPISRKRLKRSEIVRGKKARKKTPAQRKRAELRRAQEFARKYGSEERVLFVRFAMHCDVAGCLGRPENAHLDGEGTGRKGHYTRIVPLCRRHHQVLDNVLGSVAAFDEVHHTDLETAAAVVERVWQVKGPNWIAHVRADGSYESMRRAA